MHPFLFWSLIIFAWYAIGIITIISGNLLFEKRKTVTIEDLLFSLFGPLVIILFLYCVDKSIVIFDFGKKSKEKSLDNQQNARKFTP